MNNIIKVTSILAFLMVINQQTIQAQVTTSGFGFSFVTPISPPTNLNGFSIQSSNGKFIATGTAATALLGNHEYMRSLNEREKLCNNFKPENFLNILPIYSNYHTDGNQTSNAKVLSGMTELMWDNQKIFILTRHTLMGHINLSQDIYYKTFPQLEGTQLFDATDSISNQKLDILFFVKAQESVNSFIRSYRDNHKNIGKNQNWLSWQYASSGNHLSNPCSEGHSIAIEMDEQLNYNGYLGLPKGQKNFSSPGSSGSVVWNVEEPSTIRPIGIIICKQNQPEGAMQDSLMRILSFEKILNSKIEPIAFDEATRPITNLQSFPNCTPVDRESVGGDNRHDSGEQP